ncbi:EGF domain-specific O-linked N-acetylglucosamine transferase-like [Sycon ciliatum]|uniref:EGF domain-specific O-linked N-acetylglucosamine transferase-like n=1 Tax=Sycon ciliatum TaxID=27933 RepID=UPI0020ADA488|eukprot:scpid54669/ scgid10263/ Uncharacterized glycosyltransferase AER61
MVRPSADLHLRIIYLFVGLTCVWAENGNTEDAAALNSDLDYDHPKVWTKGAQRRRCWGYEKNCAESQRMFKGTSCIRKQGESPEAFSRRQGDFWSSADWGYVSKFKDSMVEICSQRSASDSLFKCSTDNAMCIAKNMYMDLRQLDHHQHGNAHRKDVLSKPGMLGGRCRMHNGRMATRRPSDVLQAWTDELEGFGNLKFRPHATAKQCDVWLDKPTVVMKFDSGVNLYHHFCDFFNLFATQHVNGSFTRDLNVVMWHTGRTPFFDLFKDVWRAFTLAGDFKPLGDYDGKRVCFRDVVFTLGPRMPLGLFYSTPIPEKCSGSGLFKAFHRHMVHRFNLTSDRGNVTEPAYRLRVKFMARKTKWRRVLNQDELIAALRSTGRYDVEVVEFTREVPLISQFQTVHNADILVGMHGAGLTHSLFLPDWGALFELYNCEDVRCYRDLAALRGAHYVTWSDKSKLTAVERSPDHLNSAVEKFSNYRMDADEFVRLVDKAATAVQQRLPKRRPKDEL